MFSQYARQGGNINELSRACNITENKTACAEIILVGGDDW